MTTLGTALVRVLPSMSGFAPAMRTGVTREIAAAGAGLTRALTIPVAAGFAGAISAAVQFESGLAGVAKTTDLSGAALNRVGDSVVKMANQMPFTREQILGVVEAAGRVGIADQNLLSFSETALKLGTATNLGAEEAATQLTRLANIVKLPQDQFSNLGSAIVALGNDFPTTEEEIARFSQRLAQVSTISTASAADVLGMSAGLASLGIRSEMGGTAMSRVFFSINDAVQQGGERLQTFARIADMSQDQFSRLWATDSTAAVQAFIGGIARLNEEGANTPALLREIGLGEIRVRDTVLRAAGGFDTFSRAIQVSNDAFGENTALQEEYAKRAATTASQFEIFKNRITNVGRAFGEGLLPIVNEWMNLLGPVADTVANLGEAFSDLPGPVKSVAVGFAALVAAIGPMMWMGAVVKASFTQIAAGIAAVTGATTANTAALAANPLLGTLGRAGATRAIPGIVGAAMAADAIHQISQRESITGMAGTGTLGVDKKTGHQEDWSWGNVGRALTFQPDIDGMIGEDFQNRVAEAQDGLQATADIAQQAADIFNAPWRSKNWGASAHEVADAMRQVGVEAQVVNGKLLYGAELSAHQAAVTQGVNQRAAQQAEFLEDINAQLRAQEEGWARNAQAVESYNQTVKSSAWGDAEFMGGVAGMSAFNQQFYSLANIAMSFESALDGVNDSLKENGFNFDLNSEKGRANQQAIMGLAQSMETQFVSAFDAANGSQTAFMENARNIGSGVMDRLTEELGLSADQAAVLAEKLGLTEGDYEIRWQMSGDEEAKVRLDLMASAIGLLSDPTKTTIALQVADGDFQGALATAESGLLDLKAQSEGLTFILKGDASDVGRQISDTKDRLEELYVTREVVITGDSSGAQRAAIDAKDMIEQVRGKTIVIQGDSKAAQRSAIDAKDRIEQVRSKSITISASDQVSGVVRNIQGALGGLKSKSINITTNYVTTGQKVKSSEGRFVAGGTWLSTTVGEISGRAGDEVILPLGNPRRMQELLSDPRVGDRVSKALGMGDTELKLSGGGGGGGGGDVNVRVFIGDQELRGIVRTEIDDDNWRAAAGSRHT
jgi:TP901 family phage tail tape measure protein